MPLDGRSYGWGLALRGLAELCICTFKRQAVTGQSGGQLSSSASPQVNMRGEVIGITSAKISPIGVEGLSYAISIDEAL